VLLSYLRRGGCRQSDVALNCTWLIQVSLLKLILQTNRAQLTVTVAAVAAVIAPLEPETVTV
jgi:hypothetical protein